MQKPKTRNLCPYDVFSWNEFGKNKFTKEDFLSSNPTVWDIEKWNETEEEKIFIS